MDYVAGLADVLQPNTYYLRDRVYPNVTVSSIDK